MALGLLNRLVGDNATRTARKYASFISRVNDIENEIRSLSDHELLGQTPHFRERLVAGETADDVMIEAFATVREAVRRLSLIHI